MELGLNKLPWYGQVGAFFLVAMIGFLVFYYYWAVPQQDSMTIRQQELAQKNLEIQRAQQTANQLPEFQAEVEELQNRLDALSAVLPEQRDASELLRRLQTLATQSNLTIRAFVPQATTQQELHSEWPIRLQLTGTYHNLGTFFDRVSKFPRIISVGDVLIRALEPARLNATITAECIATTFVLNEVAPTAPDAAPGV